MEQYADYLLVTEITAGLKGSERERSFERDIANRKSSQLFAQKGGKMRDVAKMREAIVRGSVGGYPPEDKTINGFMIPVQTPKIPFTGMENRETKVSGFKTTSRFKRRPTVLKRKNILNQGPNGIGKTTFLELLANNKAKWRPSPKE